jgi:hypothetical protein
MSHAQWDTLQSIRRFYDARTVQVYLSDGDVREVRTFVSRQIIRNSEQVRAVVVVVLLLLPQLWLIPRSRVQWIHDLVSGALPVASKWIESIVQCARTAHLPKQYVDWIASIPKVSRVASRCGRQSSDSPSSGSI